MIAGVLAVGSIATAVAGDKGEGTKKKRAPVAEKGDVDKMIADWPARPRLAAVEMMEKYGAPLEVSSEALIWHNAGPFKRVMVTRKEVPHDFPKPHMDFVEHTISYDVPTDKVDDLVAFDASMTINKTAGEMSARCDLEGHNILTHNLANDIVLGKKTVDEAREAFGMAVIDDVLGKHPPYVEKLQFDVPTGSVMFPDKPIIPGSPVRVAETSSKGGGDAEVLAFIIAVDENEVLAAMAASKEKVPDAVLKYATMLHTEHGKNAAATMKLGLKLKITPADTAAVDQLRVKGAADLAALVPLDGNEFAVAYIDAMIKGHAEVLVMIDKKLLNRAKKAGLKKHLTMTRKHVAAHLAEAKKIRTAL